MNILFLDFATEKNRGDDAMQHVMLDQIYKRYPAAHITAMAAYGINQKSYFDGHFDTQRLFHYILVPGFRLTTNRLRVGGGIRKFQKLRASSFLLASFFLMVLYRLSPELLSRFGLGAQVDAVKSADFVIWNGRNFRDRPGIGEIYDTLAIVAQA